MDGPSLQERYAPGNACFGCGPANPQGLHVRSFVEGDECVAEWTPQPHHEAFPGMLNGGIIGALLDCHANWTAAAHLMAERGVKTPRSAMRWAAAVQLAWQSSRAPMIPPLSMPGKASWWGWGVHSATHSSPSTKLRTCRPCGLAGPQPKQALPGA